ncbi:hypothetical protein [Paludisphaera rhizosphaerae]|uniref:hypothetical protein n=1 Tax=Paludisphaera rhizosphaerae TaxID=2711216 RepID=UPI0019810CCB|nr:hypothetical protein [Paludisphaera rhizosphaerae]
MPPLKFVYWQDGDGFLGYLEDFPDHWTQGESLDELKTQLADLHHELANGEELSDERKALLDQRLAHAEANPDAFSTLEEVWARLAGRYREE